MPAFTHLSIPALYHLDSVYEGPSSTYEMCVSFRVQESIRGGDLESLLFFGNGEALLLSVLVNQPDVSKTNNDCPELIHSLQSQEGITEQIRWIGRTYDRLLSPSFLNNSIVFRISFLPPAASTTLPPILILTFSLAFALSNLFNNKCFI